MVIAEIGVNHNGDMKLAKKLVDTAKDVGANVAKFQAFLASDLATASAPSATYQVANTGRDRAQLHMLKELELSRDDLRALFDYCSEVGIEFMASGFSSSDVVFLDELDVQTIKVPSGEITNLPYLRTVAECGRPVILSTGMATLEEVVAAVRVFEASGLPRTQVTVLHCTTDYPTPLDDVNLMAMLTLRDVLGTEVGYSDHTEGTLVAPIAVALGAVVIEKHLTLDKTLPGPDHRASLNPSEFEEMVANIRATELAMGDGDKAPRERELANRAVARKSLVASRPIDRGEAFSAENVTSKRPGTGISPMLWEEIVGKPAPRAFYPDELIEL